jgi:hypothetical protein
VVAAAAGLLVAVAAARILGGESGSAAPVPVPTAQPEPAPAAPAPRITAEPVPAPPGAPAPVAAGGEEDDFFAKLRAESEERRQMWIGRWRPAEMSVTWKPMQWDVTGHIKSAGRFGVTFGYTKGRHRLNIQWAALLEDGKEVSRDAHHGMTGGRSRENTYTLDLARHRPGSRYVLHASVRSDGGTDSSGDIWLRVLP